jgi:hypothetical protein
MQCRRTTASRLLRPFALAVGFWVAVSRPATGIVGGAPIADPTIARHVALVWGIGSACSGAVIASDLILTAAHCVRSRPSEIYFAASFDGQRFMKATATRVVPHPQFAKELAGGRRTADLAILKVSLLGHLFPVPLSGKEAIWTAERFVVAGFGRTEPQGKWPSADGRMKPLAATLVLSGFPSAQTVVLIDPATRGKSAGLGACHGDSGGPVFEETSGRRALIGIMTSATGPQDAAVCGATTGVTVLAPHLGWIADTAILLGSSLVQ